MMTSGGNNSILSEDDLLKITLNDLKRTVREYTTATTESNCDTVRQMFSQLTDSTLKLQGELYNLMSSQNIYSPPAKAARNEVDNQLQSAHQTQQKLQSVVQQGVQQSTGGFQPLQGSAFQQGLGNTQ